MLATNAVGSSAAALAPVVALALAQQNLPVISGMALNATINEAFYLQLPALDASYSYVVTSKQNFEVSVEGNQLKVLSTNETDVGTKYLDLVALSSSNKVTFIVKVIFKALHMLEKSNSAVSSEPNTSLVTQTITETS